MLATAHVFSYGTQDEAVQRPLQEFVGYRGLLASRLAAQKVQVRYDRVRMVHRADSRVQVVQQELGFRGHPLVHLPYLYKNPRAENRYLTIRTV